MSDGTATPLADWIAGGLGLDAGGVVGSAVGGTVAAALVLTVILANAAVAGPWAKRKIMAAFWGKLGPNRIGPWGLLIIPADVIRLLSKELIVPDSVDRPAYDLGPLLMTASALLGFAVVPFGTVLGVELQVADPEIGVLYAFAVASLASLGLAVSGYASNNKFAFLGGMRSIAQNIAYEIPLVLVGASVVMLAGSLQVSEIVAAQSGTLLTLGPVSIPNWFVFVNPLAFFLFVAANLAEVGRNPFDLPEAPQEIVAGHMTEYSSVYFVLLYLAEFLHIFLGGALIAVLFLGGPGGPVLPGAFWMLAKIWAVFVFTQWARASIPRVRVDQLIQIGWKGLLVLSFVNLLATAVIVGLA